MNKLGSTVALGFTLLAACSSGGAGQESDEVVGVGDPHAAAVEASEATSAEAPRVRIEKSLRDLDRGGDAKAVKASLEALLHEPAISDDDKNDASLALSRAFEALGDEESAIDTLEAMLMSRKGERSSSIDAAEKRLRILVTGADKKDELSLPPSEAPAPIASALAELFTADENGHVLVDVYAFGRGRGDNHGIFEIAEAKRQKMEMDLGGKISVGQSISGTDSWVGLPRAMGEADGDMPQADRSLLVFYYDLADLKVPSRYDDYLPMPSDDIADVLEHGEGLVMARKRNGAKPTIVIAAPRRAQLDLVEEAFSKMTEVPFEAVRVPLEKKLRPREIQATVRAARNEMRACYEAGLKNDKTLAGSVVLEFGIEPDGTVSKNTIGAKSTLPDAAVAKCLNDMVGTLSFPAFGGDRVNVTYPLAFSP
ncbi:MAG: AgmX/PglI C-terminal domain-containing protein [Myxococcales bacterium]|nr:AgmX/PglI C-terminal domain-containing protein [Myxococcales bacterium]